ncbi:hypothetical protein ACOMHN_022973 [Nucella lapillus]
MSDQDSKPGKRKKKRSNCTYSVSALQQALNAIKEEKLSFRVAAAKFGIPSTTLKDHSSGRSHICAKAGRKRSVPLAVENEIVDKAIAAAKAGCPMTKRQVLVNIANAVIE